MRRGCRGLSRGCHDRAPPSSNVNCATKVTLPAESPAAPGSAATEAAAAPELAAAAQTREAAATGAAATEAPAVPAPAAPIPAAAAGSAPRAAPFVETTAPAARTPRA